MPGKRRQGLPRLGITRTLYSLYFGQRLFKDEWILMIGRGGTQGPQTIGQRNKIIQQWWESLSDSKKADGRAAKNGISWVHLRRLMILIEKNFPGMAREFIDMVHRTMGSHIVMFAAHEAQIVRSRWQYGKKAFSESSEPSKDWVLKGEQILTDYLLSDPVEEELNEEKKDTENTPG
ncbi:hypothetical protein EDD16DRAFT_1529336 [Pisolithus croceorrhizus]|nr:hypothetical protein EDD16DRAFT_1529336 [Pisolithus croceorrhizus]